MNDMKGEGKDLGKVLLAHRGWEGSRYHETYAEKGDLELGILVLWILKVPKKLVSCIEVHDERYLLPYDVAVLGVSKDAKGNNPLHRGQQAHTYREVQNLPRTGT
jgi:hypothetical protein